MADGWYDGLDGTALAAAIRAGDVSAAEAVDAAISRIEAIDPVVHAVVAERFDAAREEAARPLGDGPFAGVPYVVKALGANVTGLPTSRGSQLWADDVATADSLAVARVRAAGVIVLGMTNTPELGKNGSTEPRFHGPTRNPHDLSRSTGGSSGGSAAAVASGMVPVAHGNDGGGSIRIPSAACGLFGLKPSRGRVPNPPFLEAFSYPVGCTHSLTRTVRDSAALLDVVAGPTDGDAVAVARPARPFLAEVGADPGRLRIGFTTVTARGVTAHDDLVTAVARTATVCESLGHDVEEAEFTYDADAANGALAAVMSVNVAFAVDARLAALGRELRDDDIEPFTRVLYDGGRTMPGTTVVGALQQLERTSREVAPFFERYDLLLTPTLSIRVPELGWVDTSRPETMVNAAAFSAFTGVFNTTGHPAMSVPAGVDGNGLPVGVQFVARPGDEATLLRLAAALEVAAPWPTAPVVPPTT
ncbi:MAG TPA: amidase family protein [Acidimicrobiia bacterium]|nr:amidase family protein [Acidimicrobiia bacterium]